MVATTFVPTTEDKPCDRGVYYDCQDTNCISRTLLCNGVRNCKFGWDEETECTKEDEEKPILDMATPHVQVRRLSKRTSHSCSNLDPLLSYYRPSWWC